MDTDARPSRGADRVATAGAVTALVSCLLLPFVSLATNRLAQGSSHGIWSAGALGVALIGASGVALAAAIAPLGPRRGLVLRWLAAAIFALLAFSLGHATVGLLPGAGTYARVSLGPAAWLTLLGAAVVSFAGGRASGGGAWASRAADAAAVVAVIAAAVWGGLARLSIAMEYAVQADRFWAGVGQHLALTGLGLAFGAVLGVPLGVLAARHSAVRRIALGVVGVIQTIPSLALLGLLIAPLAALRVASPLLAGFGLSGIGPWPAVIALTLYALLPIVRGTYVGLSEVDPAAVDAGRGMGMSRRQLLLRVELPLALPLVLEGLRAAAVLVIGIAAVSALIGAGGLGVLVFTGLGQQASDLVLLGAIPIILLALAADIAVRAIERSIVSPGIRAVRP